MTKSFTAMAIMKLRDDGRVSLDAAASTYLPELRTLVGVPRDAPVTVRMLLTHGSGLPYDDYWGADSFGMTDAELTRFLQAGVRLSHAPGAVYAYSNLGYALLGRIVARVSGVSFRDYVSQNILRPLGMRSSVWDAAQVPPERLATGYWKTAGGALVPEPRPPDGVFDAAGGLYTSLRDYARYVAFNLDAYPARDDQPESAPLRRSTVREMHDGQREMRADDRDAPLVRRLPDGMSLRAGSYGFGWLRLITCSEERVQHGGYEPGYFSTVVLLPKERAGIFVLATTARVAAAVMLPALAGAGVLSPPDEAAPIPELADAAASINQLLEAWDGVRAAQTFDEPSSKFAWFASLPQDVAQLAARHGRCRPRGSLKTYGRYRGLWQLTCDRGAVELDALMTPGTPARVEVLKWVEELPPDERLRGVAARVAAALGKWKELDVAAADLLAGSNPADRRRMERAMAHLAIDYGVCAVEGGAVRSNHEPLGDDRPHAVFRLRCDGGPLDLELAVDDASGKIVELDGHPPRDPDATCWR